MTTDIQNQQRIIEELGKINDMAERGELESVLVFALTTEHTMHVTNYLSNNEAFFFLHAIGDLLTKMGPRLFHDFVLPRAVQEHKKCGDCDGSCQCQNERTH